MQKRVLLSAAALASLVACSTYDPYYTSNPPNPDPAPSSAMRTAPAPSVATAPAAPAPVTVAPLSANVAPASGTVAPGTIGYRAGYGVIESISLVYQPRPASASAGASVSNTPDPGPYRMTVRMDDGSLQSMVVDSRTFMVGDRVQMMNDGRVARL
jgi:hypothetical protein